MRQHTFRLKFVFRIPVGSSSAAAFFVLEIHASGHIFESTGFTIGERKLDSLNPSLRNIQSQSVVWGCLRVFAIRMRYLAHAVFGLRLSIDGSSCDRIFVQARYRATQS